MNPPDLRAENEMRTLAKAGYDIHLLSYDFSGLKSKIETFDKVITIHRVKVSKHFHNKFNALALTLPVYFSFWKKQTKDLIIQTILVKGKNFSLVVIPPDAGIYL